MLSDRERRELALIEEGLRADPRFVASFAGGAHRRRRRWPVRATVACGVVLTLAGLLVGVEQLVMEGLLVTFAGLAWRWWQGARAAAVPRGTNAEDAGREPGPHRPEWFGPV